MSGLNVQHNMSHTRNTVLFCRIKNTRFCFQMAQATSSNEQPVDRGMWRNKVLESIIELQVDSSFRASSFSPVWHMQLALEMFGGFPTCATRMGVACF